MHAYLVITSDSKKAKEKASEIFKKERIIGFEIQKVSDTKELVRRTNIALDPTVFFLENFDGASIEAQNAFLKRLEEPQENLNFVLCAANEDKVLPTIISRCQVIRISGRKEVSNEERKKALEFLEADIGSRFSTISKITKRQEASEFLQGIILSLSLSAEKRNKDKLKEAQKTLQRINQNANPTIQLTSFALSFSLQ